MPAPQGSTTVAVRRLEVLDDGALYSEHRGSRAVDRGKSSACLKVEAANYFSKGAGRWCGERTASRGALGPGRALATALRRYVPIVLEERRRRGRSVIGGLRLCLISRDHRLCGWVLLDRASRPASAVANFRLMTYQRVSHSRWRSSATVFSAASSYGAHTPANGRLGLSWM